MFKKYRPVLLAIIAMIAPTMAFAGYPWDFCWNNLCCGTYDFALDVLFLRPSGGDLAFVIRDNRDVQDAANGILGGTALPFGTEKCLEPTYEIGVRASARYIFGCGSTDIFASYTNLIAHHTSQVSPSKFGALWPTVSHPTVLLNTVGQSAALSNNLVSTQTTGVVRTIARGKVKYQYNAADGSVGQKLCWGSTNRFLMRPYFGGHFFSLQHRFQVRYHGNEVPGGTSTDAETLFTEITQYQTLWGLGPKFGVDCAFALHCGISLHTQVSGAILTGNRRTKYDQSGTRNYPSEVTTYQLAADDGTRAHLVVPTFQTSVGVGYSWCCNPCYTFSVEVGYEFDAYVGALHRLTFNDSEATCNTDCCTFSLDGFYLHFVLEL